MNKEPYAIVAQLRKHKLLFKKSIFKNEYEVKYLNVHDSEWQPVNYDIRWEYKQIEDSVISMDILSKDEYEEFMVLEVY